MAVGDGISHEEDRILTAVFRECEELRARKYLEFVPTNQELAKRYGVGRRTITNWRKAGCPFEGGQWAVLDWLAGRRYAPAGANSKFGPQLAERKHKAIWAGVEAERKALVSDARRLKGLYQAEGLNPGDWLSHFRAIPAQGSSPPASPAKDA